MLTRLITALQLRFGLRARRLPLTRSRRHVAPPVGIERRDEIDFIAVRPAGNRAGDPVHFYKVTNA